MNPEQWLSLKWNGGSTMSDRWLNQSKIIHGGNNMSENQVKITYKPLWKLLIDRDMTKTELRKKTQIAPSTFTKMNNDQQVSLDILARICVELKCGFDDIVEIEQ